MAELNEWIQAKNDVCKFAESVLRVDGTSNFYRWARYFLEKEKEKENMENIRTSEDLACYIDMSLSPFQAEQRAIVATTLNALFLGERLCPDIKAQLEHVLYCFFTPDKEHDHSVLPETKKLMFGYILQRYKENPTMAGSVGRFEEDMSSLFLRHGINIYSVEFLPPNSIYVMPKFDPVPVFSVDDGIEFTEIPQSVGIELRDVLEAIIRIREHVVEYGEEAQEVPKNQPNESLRNNFFFYLNERRDNMLMSIPNGLEENMRDAKEDFMAEFQEHDAHVIDYFHDNVRHVMFFIQETEECQLRCLFLIHGDEVKMKGWGLTLKETLYEEIGNVLWGRKCEKCDSYIHPTYFTRALEASEPEILDLQALLENISDMKFRCCHCAPRDFCDIGDDGFNDLPSRVTEESVGGLYVVNPDNMREAIDIRRRADAAAWEQRNARHQIRQVDYDEMSNIHENDPMIKEALEKMSEIISNVPHILLTTPRGSGRSFAQHLLEHYNETIRRGQEVHDQMEAIVCNVNMDGWSAPTGWIEWKIEEDKYPISIASLFGEDEKNE